MHETDDRVIYIKDLFFVMLYQWRKIVIVAVALALLAGVVFGFQAHRSSAAIQADPDFYAKLEAYEEEKASLENRLESIASQIENQKEYIAVSPLMDLDPYNIQRASVSYTVFTDYQIMPDKVYQNVDTTATILNAYSNIPYNADILDAMSEKLGIPSKYIIELISVHDGGTANHTITFDIVYHDKALLQEMLTILTEGIAQAQARIQEDVGIHTLQLVNSVVRSQMDQHYAQVQTDAITRLTMLEESQLLVTQQLQALADPSVAPKSVVKEAVVGAILGGVLGTFAVAGIACVAHIAGGKVYSARTLKNRTGIKVLGCTPSGAKRNALDKWLRKLEGRCCDYDNVDSLAAILRNYTADAKHVLVAGGWDAASSLSEAVKDANTQFTFCDSLLGNVDALNCLSQSDCVLLLLQCGKSNYGQIFQELQIITDQSRLLGCILIDG